MASLIFLHSTPENKELVAKIEDKAKNPFKWEWLEKEVEIKVCGVLILELMNRNIDFLCTEMASSNKKSSFHCIFSRWIFPAENSQPE